MNLNMRQMLNNAAIPRGINGSTLGCAFQESEFARGVEAILSSFGDGVSNALASGEGFASAIGEGIYLALAPRDAAHRQMFRQWTLQAVRPDLCGKIDPRRYDDALREVRNGETVAEIMERYRR